MLQVGSSSATVNGKSEAGRSPVQREGRVLIPLSSFSDQFGVNVGWNQATRTPSCRRGEMHLRAFYALQSFQERDLVASMNSVAFGWSRIDREGQFTLQGDEYRLPAAAGDVTPQSIVANATDREIKPYLMVYALDGNGELTKVLSDSDLRQKSIEGITAAVAENGLAELCLILKGSVLNWMR